MNIKSFMLGGALASTLAVATIATSGAAGAHEISPPVAVPGAAFAVACANGGSYVLRSRAAVLEPGEIVTARLYLRPHHAVSMRLIPMGDGYRYAGRGIWLDGIRDQATLYLRKYDPVPCTVTRI